MLEPSDNKSGQTPVDRRQMMKWSTATIGGFFVTTMNCGHPKESRGSDPERGKAFESTMRAAPLEDAAMSTPTVTQEQESVVVQNKKIAAIINRLETIPAELAQVVHVVPVEHPKRVLINIPMIHLSGKGNDPRLLRDMVGDVQGNIKDSLEWLHDTFQMSGIFCDGVSATSRREVRKLIEGVREVERLIGDDVSLGIARSINNLRLRQRLMSDPKDILEVDIVIDHYQKAEAAYLREKEVLEHLRLFHPGMDLTLQGKIRRYVTEDESLLEKTITLLSLLESSTLIDFIPRQEGGVRISLTDRIEKDIEALSDQREDFAIQRIARSYSVRRDGLAVSVFGNDHDLSNNVIEHNKNNPDNQIYLIDLYPDRMAHYYQRDGTPTSHNELEKRRLEEIQRLKEGGVIETPSSERNELQEVDPQGEPDHTGDLEEDMLKSATESFSRRIRERLKNHRRRMRRSHFP